MTPSRSQFFTNLLGFAATMALAGAVVAPAPALAVEVLAFGDSMTLGIGDATGEGYPRRLKRKLDNDSTVSNQGAAGESTLEGLSRLDGVLSRGGDVILLMEGTNDINEIAQGLLSVETTLANIDAMISKSEAASIEPILASIIPRPPYAKRDRRNTLTTSYVGDLRALALARDVRFTDTFNLFDPELVPNGFDDYYWDDPDDTVGHLNEAGYDRLASAFADLLNGIDTAPPVFGNFEPGPLPNEVPGGIRIRVPVFDFKGGSGLNLSQTQLLINGKAVTDGLESEGTEKGVELTHKGEKALGCRAVLQVVAEDTAEPPNVLSRVLAVYAVAGKTVPAGDVDFDCRVDGVDLVGVAQRLGVGSKDPRYGVPFDLNRDGVIDEEDLAVVTQNFGKTSL